MTSLFIQGTLDFFSSSNPVVLIMSATPQSIDTYKIVVNLSPKNSITRLHFSIITFDQAEIQSSGQYLIVY
jgi:hypothetical protein